MQNDIRITGTPSADKRTLSAWRQEASRLRENVYAWGDWTDWIYVLRPDGCVLTVGSAHLEIWAPSEDLPREDATRIDLEGITIRGKHRTPVTPDFAVGDIVSPLGTRDKTGVVVPLPAGWGSNVCAVVWNGDKTVSCYNPFHLRHTGETLGETRV